MKRQSVKFQLCLSVSMFLAVFFGVASLASAEFSCAHGSSGQVYDESAIDTANLMGPGLRFGWGLGYAQLPNKENWIVYPIPTKVPSVTRYIGLQLDTVLGGDLYVDRVAVWNRNAKVVPDIEVNWSGEVGIQVLDLGSDFPVESLSISIRTRTGDFGGQLKVYTVCAESR